MKPSFSRRFLLAVLLGGLSLAGAAPAATAADSNYLDVSIALFEENLPEDPLARERLEIQAEVRQAESRYLPAYLQARLVDSGRWGAVRVVPRSGPGAELMISGRILQSDGASLRLALRAEDSSGRLWLDGEYAAQARPSVSLLRPGREPDPFEELYSRVLADLEAVLAGLPPAEIARLKNLALLHYAASLLPGAYGGFLEQDPQGRYGYSRLPAADDPMLARIEEIRRHEYLFIDVVDEQYRSFAAGIRPVYDLWRDYRREQMAESQGFEQREQASSSRFRPGSYRDLRESYDNYRWAKMQEQYLDEIAAGFANEIESTEIDLEDRLYQLNGTIEQQYAEWKEILRTLLEIETGG